MLLNSLTAIKKVISVMRKIRSKVRSPAFLMPTGTEVLHKLNTGADMTSQAGTWRSFEPRGRRREHIRREQRIKRNAAI